MNYNTFEKTVEHVHVPEGVDASSIYHTLELVEDGRKKRGVRYSVALILTLILLGKGAGMTTPAAIAEWVRLRGKDLSEILPTTRTTFPCAATYSNVLRVVNAEQINEV